MMNSSREWNFPAVMTAKRLLMKSVSTFFFNFATQKTGGILIGLFLLLKSAQQQALKAKV
jgi:hypothetical protein